MRMISVPSRKTTQNLECSGKLSIIGSSLFAVIFFLLGLFLHKYGITQFLLEERLKMREFMPHFKWWQNTSEVLVTCKIYVFSVTNGQRWLENLDDRLNFEEIGPITYQETLEHLDVVFHKNNSTISYNSRRQLVFMPDQNENEILNKTITIPNVAVLAMAAKLQSSNSLVKWGYRLILSRSGDDVFINTTVQNYLWNLTPPVIQQAKKVVPFMVPIENIGVLNVMYRNYNDRVNVRYGKRYGHEQFFMMNTYGYRPTVPGFTPENGDCFASIVNATEGALYQQKLNDKSVLIYWRKTLCRPVPLYFEKKVKIESLVGYKYVLLDSSYDRLANSSNDCYKGQTNLLENGMTDMSKCFTDFPVVATSPHYYARNLSTAKRISGMKPDRERHHSYIIADPSLGIPFDQCARTQSNLMLPKLTGFPVEIIKFSEMILPMFWIEYHQNGLPPHLLNPIKYFYFIQDVQSYLPYLFYIIFFLLLLISIHKAKTYDTVVAM